jgi:hypothetical protein
MYDGTLFEASIHNIRRASYCDSYTFGELFVHGESFDVEMDNSSMELIKYFTTRRRGME